MNALRSFFKTPIRAAALFSLFLWAVCVPLSSEGRTEPASSSALLSQNEGATDAQVGAHDEQPAADAPAWDAKADGAGPQRALLLASLPARQTVPRYQFQNSRGRLGAAKAAPERRPPRNAARPRGPPCPALATFVVASV